MPRPRESRPLTSMLCEPQTRYASAFGMRVIWCNRYRQLRERLPGKPDCEVHTLELFPEILGL